MHELTHTIQIPIEEIQNEIELLNTNKIESYKEKNNITNDTRRLFTKDKLKEAIKKRIRIHRNCWKY